MLSSVVWYTQGASHFALGRTLWPLDAACSTSLNLCQVLAALVQAVHELVPPETVAPVLRQLVDQFVHDRWAKQLWD